MSSTDSKPPTQSSGLASRSGRLAPFGPPPLFEGEDTSAYDEFLARISATVKPADILEDIWVRDFVDLVWDSLRLRRLKANLMTSTAYKGLAEILNPLVGYSDKDFLVKAWAKRGRGAIKKVDKLLASAGLIMEAVMAQTLSINLDDIERIDHMIATAEIRRIAILREIDRHRVTLGHALRQAAEQIEDADYKVIEGKEAAARSAA